MVQANSTREGTREKQLHACTEVRTQNRRTRDIQAPNTRAHKVGTCAGTKGATAKRGVVGAVHAGSRRGGV